MSEKEENENEECCCNCIHFNSLPIPYVGECDLELGRRIHHTDCCEYFFPAMLIKETIDKLAVEEPLLTFDCAIQRIFEIHNGFIPLKLIKHLIISSESHKPVYEAWMQYKENRKELTRKRPQKKMTTEERSYLKKIELGLIPNPDGPTLIQEAREIMNSGQVCELCEQVGLDCTVVKRQKMGVLKEYRRIMKKERYKI